MTETIQNTDVKRPPYGIITVLMIGAFIAFLNNTLLNIALPSIMTDLNVKPATVQWLTTGFMLVNGVLVPMSAYFIQKYSVRRLFLVAMGIFAFGTLVAGMAPSFSLLLTGRMMQAAGTAIMMPLLMNVMLVSFPIEKRGTVMGMFGMIMMAAPAIGPTLSGWIVEHYEWRMLFHFVWPIALAIFGVGFLLLKDKKEKVNLKLDLVSLALSTVGFGGVLFGFSSAGNAGFDSPRVYLPIVIGVIALVTFIRRQNGQEKPMLNFGVYRYPMFALSSAISMVLNMAMFSGMLLLPIYVQTIRGISPMDAGLMLLPGALVMAFMSPVTGRLFDKFGGRMLAIVGLTIMVVTTYQFSTLTTETPYFYLMALHAVRMFGITMVMMPVSTNGLNQLPRKFYPHGTAMNNTLNQLSGAIGTALLVTIMSIQTEKYLSGMMQEGAVTDSSVIEGFNLLAMLEGINDAFFVATCIAIVALGLSFFIKRARPADEEEKDKAAA
ncbi:MAG: DHA2 family efflux MFS transporter permease subunit [Bacillaceae bacterium]|nr:DHA2 family efflux MFS transporter permease subunit [Bacillaceae bacterium]